MAKDTLQGHQLSEVDLEVSQDSLTEGTAVQRPPADDADSGLGNGNAEEEANKVASNQSPCEEALGLRAGKSTKVLWRLAKARATESGGDALVALTELVKLKEETLQFDTKLVDPVSSTAREEMLAPVGPLALFFALVRPGSSQVRHVVGRLWNLTWGLKPLMLLSALFSLLLWVAGLVTLPGLVSLALRLTYNGSGIAQLKLEMFVVWFILCAICLAFANVLNQFILGRNRTNLCHQLSSRILAAKEAYPDLLTKEDLNTFLVKDMASLRRVHVSYHQAVERSLVCIACWIVLMARSPMLGLLALAIIFASIMVTSASDLFNHSRGKAQEKKEVREGGRKRAKSDFQEAVENYKDNPNPNPNPNQKGTSSLSSSSFSLHDDQGKEIAQALAYITREEKFEQNMHMIAGGAMRLLMYSGPVLFIFVAGELVKKGDLDSDAIAYCFMYFLAVFVSYSSCLEAQTATMASLGGASRLFLFSEGVEKHVDSQKKLEGANAMPLEPNRGKSHSKTVYFVLFMISSLVSVFVIALLASTADNGGINCEPAKVKCKSPLTGEVTITLAIPQEFSWYSGCTFQSTKTEVTTSCAQALSKLAVHGGNTTVTAEYQGWDGKTRVLESGFQLQSSGLAKKRTDSKVVVIDKSAAVSRRRLMSGGSAGLDGSATMMSSAGGVFEGQQYFDDSASSSSSTSTSSGSTTAAAAAAAGPPSTWLCPASYFDAQDGCDCACGGWDPDCDISGSYVFNCGYGQTCEKDSSTGFGSCSSASASSSTSSTSGGSSSGGSSGPPSSWTCSPSYFDAQDGCDCACGAWDPDCDVAGATLYNCNGQETCQNSTTGGICVAPGAPPPTPAPAPTPSPTPAPAPSPTPAPTPAPAPTPTPAPTPSPTPSPTPAPTPSPTPAPTPSASQGTMTVSALPETPPPEWSPLLCSLSYYNANDGCDCGCGAPDPDCNQPYTALYGCPPFNDMSTTTCIQGVCAAIGTSSSNLASGTTVVDASGNQNTNSEPCPCNTFASDGSCLCDCQGYTYSTWMEGSNSYFECHKPKNCSAWFEKYPTYLQASSRAHLVGKNFSDCMANDCAGIGNGACQMTYPDENLNTPQCHYDGGDCCELTSVSNSYQGLTPNMCIDPNGMHTDPWQGVRGACSQSVYKGAEKWDHCVKGIIGIEHHVVPAGSGSPGGRRRLASSYFTYSSNWTGSDTVYGFPPDYMQAYNSTLYSNATLNCDIYGCQDPSLPRIYDEMKGDSIGIYQGEYEDWEFNATAGEFLSVRLNGGPGHIGTTFEVIAPDASGKVDDPTLMVPHKTTSKSLLLAKEVINEGGTQYFNQTQCMDQHATQCSCYSCMCSCGGELFELSEVPKSFCVPYGLNSGTSCPGAYTNHHRVYLDPPAGGYTLEVFMTRANEQDDWPMVVTVENVRRSTDQYCNHNSTFGVQECCWPYSGNSENVGCPPRFDGPIALAASALYQGNERKIKLRIQEKGFYLISCKALGYMGGNYLLHTKISDIAIGTDDPNAKRDMTPGPMVYGQTVGGNINTTGQVDEWQFNGTALDKIYIGAGPYFDPMTPADLSRCGKPYGKGRICVDTFLMLISPSGKMEAYNHEGKQNQHIGSMIGTYVIEPNPFFSEAEDGSLFTRMESRPHVLRETGTYTIRTMGSTFFDDKNQRIMNGFSPTGEYYLQLLKVGALDTLTEPHCPLLPENATLGFKEPGCANYVWKAHNGRPRVAERHPNCEKFYPVAPPVGTGAFYSDHEMKDWRLRKTGKYIIRVRSTINNCFREQVGPYGQSAMVCKPSSGAYDLKIRKTSTPSAPEKSQWGLPDYPSISLINSTTVTNIAMDKFYAIANECGSASSVQDNVCHTEMVFGKHVCDEAYKYVDTMHKDGKMEKYTVTRVGFNATAGDVLCIDVPYPSHYMSGVVEKVSKLELRYRNTFNSTQVLLVDDQFKGWFSYIDYGEGMAIKGYKVPQTGVYEAWVYGGNDNFNGQYGNAFADLTQIKVSKCPSEFKNVSLTESGSGGSDCMDPFVPATTFDKCVANPLVEFSESDTKVTFPKDKGTSIVMSKIGFPIQETGGLPGTNDKPRYYWEVTVGGNPRENWVNYMDTHSVAIGFATRDVNNQGLWLGGDDQAFSYMNSYDKGRSFNNGGSQSYGNMFLPGDVVSVAIDLNTNRYWFGINGTWQASSTGFDYGGTKYNNYPETGEPMWECQPPRPEEVMSPAMFTQFGRDKCPIPEGAPTCPHNDEFGKNRPSCSWGNPVADSQCTQGNFVNWYGQHSKRIGTSEYHKLKDDVFSSITQKKLYPAVQGDGKYDNVSYEINFGNKPFKYTMPCSFQPLSDEIKANSEKVGPKNSDCWTCKGQCVDFDSSTTPGTHSCKTWAPGAGTDAYFLDKYGMNALS